MIDRFVPDGVLPDLLSKITFMAGSRDEYPEWVSTGSLGPEVVCREDGITWASRSNYRTPVVLKCLDQLTVERELRTFDCTAFNQVDQRDKQQRLVRGLAECVR